MIAYCFEYPKGLTHFHLTDKCMAAFGKLLTSYTLKFSGAKAYIYVYFSANGIHFSVFSQYSMSYFP
jgi:hypothetical protein